MASTQQALLPAPAVSWSPEVLRLICTRAVDGLLALPQRGIEVGGLLLGSVNERAPYLFSIEAIAPIECEHQSGPGFILSDNDRMKVAHLLAETRACGEYCVVGYYRSRTARDAGPELDEADRQLIAEYFPEPSHLFLSIRPWSMRHCEGALYHWLGDQLVAVGERFELGGQPRFHPPVAELEPSLLDLPEPPLPAVERLDAEPPRVSAPKLDPAKAPVQLFDLPMPDNRLRREQFWRVAAISLAILAGLLLLVRQDRQPAIVPAAAQTETPPVAFQISGNTGQLSWDPSTHRIEVPAVQAEPGSLKLTILPAVAQDNSPKASAKDAPKRTTKGQPQATSEEAVAKRAVALGSVSPVIPESIRARMTAPITVRVRVQIDENGVVISSRPAEYAGGLERYLARQAADAASKARFSPAVTSSGRALATFEDLRVTIDPR